jgi:phosphatidylserine/phosphatidylglycerophosphate/cardiolipin synthase-like enzyme
LITQSRENLVFLAPFYSAQGLEKISETLLPLLKNQKDIKIEFFCNDLDNFNKRNRAAFEHLNSIVNREYGQIPYRIFMPNRATQNYENILIHAKFIISDNRTGYLGSANISKSALESQLELGVRISQNQSELINKILDKLISEKYFIDVTGNI